MNMLINLEKAIEELEAQKDELFQKIESCGWEDDRHFEPIPETREIIKNPIDNDIFDQFKNTEVIRPEKRPLPCDIGGRYQKWYGAARVIIEKNQPVRLNEFDDIYDIRDKKNRSGGIRQLILRKYLEKKDQFLLFDLINRQFDILAAVPNYLRYSIYDIELTAYSILMDDEISASMHLLSKGFLRPAGALAGVILERHLKNLLRKHIPPIKYKETDALSALNELCKKHEIYDVIEWRRIQHLTDLRNLCDHPKEREPTKEEISDLINGISKILKTCN